LHGAESDLFFVPTASLGGRSTSLEYLALLITKRLLSIRILLLSDDLLGTTTERESVAMHTAVAAGDWHMKPLIFLVVLTLIADQRERERERCK
jgi:hypothetical protein